MSKGEEKTTAQEQCEGQGLQQNVVGSAAGFYVQQQKCQCLCDVSVFLGFSKYRACKIKDFRLILTKNEQLSNPIMIWVSSGMGVGPRLTSDMSFSTCGKDRQIINTDFHSCHTQFNTFPIITMPPN